MKPVVGELRAQAAYKSSDSPVVIVSADPAVQKLNLQVVEFYPDSDGTFKIKVQSGVEDSIQIGKKLTRAECLAMLDKFTAAP